MGACACALGAPCAALVSKRFLGMNVSKVQGFGVRKEVAPFGHLCMGNHRLNRDLVLVTSSS